MRLIDADAFKEYMWKALEETRGCYPDKGEWAEAITKQFCKDIDDQPTAQPEPNWIPCSERLPQFGHPVLWCNEKGSVFISAITVQDDISWAIGKRHRFTKVIAWMPLPECYRGEEDG